MKKSLKIFIASSLLIMPTLNYSQTTDIVADNTPVSSALQIDLYPAADYPEAAFNQSSIIKPNLFSSKLVGGVNTGQPEIGAIISPDGKTLYFSRYQDTNNIGGKDDEEDIWYSDWDEKNNRWGEAKNIGAPLNNKYPNFINSISADGKTILLGNVYFTNGKMGPGFSTSTKTETGWSFPKEMNVDGIKAGKNWSGGDLSSDQKVLFVAYEQRKNTFGNRDIYISFLRADNSWTKPANLGGAINTLGDETAPFLADDDSTLYYTSNGLPGYGGNDIYVTHRLDDTWQNWSKPENLGPKVNTAYHQSFFSIAKDKMYYSSECKKSKSLDLFTLDALELNTPVSFPSAEQTVVLENKTQTSTSNFSTTPLNYDTGTSVIFYDFNSSELKKSTIYELARISKILNEFPLAQIEISGQTDNVGSDVYNQQLSQKRTDAILLYFKYQSKINEKRIIIKNYGETMPIANNETEKGRELNRRVEISFKTKLLVNN